MIQAPNPYFDHAIEAPFENLKLTYLRFATKNDMRKVELILSGVNYCRNSDLLFYILLAQNGILNKII